MEIAVGMLQASSLHDLHSDLDTPQQHHGLQYPAVGVGGIRVLGALEVLGVARPRPQAGQLATPALPPRNGSDIGHSAYALAQYEVPLATTVGASIGYGELAPPPRQQTTTYAKLVTAVPPGEEHNSLDSDLRVAATPGQPPYALDDSQYEVPLATTVGTSIGYGEMAPPPRQHNGAYAKLATSVPAELERASALYTVPLAKSNRSPGLATPVTSSNAPTLPPRRGTQRPPPTASSLQVNGYGALGAAPDGHHHHAYNVLEQTDDTTYCVPMQSAHKDGGDGGDGGGGVIAAHVYRASSHEGGSGTCVDFGAVMVTGGGGGASMVINPRLEAALADASCMPPGEFGHEIVHSYGEIARVTAGRLARRSVDKVRLS